MVDTVPAWTPPPPSSSGSRTPTWQPSQRESFESALKRADNSRSRDDEDDSSVDESDSSDEGEPDALSDTSARRDAGQGNASAQAAGTGIAGHERAKKLASLEGDAAAGSVESSSGGVSQPGLADNAGPAPSTPTAPVQAPLMVETVAAMMMRLERMPEANAGQWQFNLVDDPAGIASLQLQRALNGGWKVHISVNPGSEVDQEQHAGELKMALEQRGHPIDSIQVALAEADPETELS